MKVAQERLLEWYRANRRDFPWRKNKSPYFVWISEVMSQQTTLQVVLPYFERFITRFPTVEKLAKAPVEDVLSLWSGLGYYSRARNLHKAAQAIADLGKFPRTAVELMELPGLGPYTASAVASIAFDEPIAAVDGNVQRVIARLEDLEVSAHTSPGKILFQKHASRWLNQKHPGDHNQAVMELGATICTPTNPACLICPLYKFCEARKNGTIELRPMKKARRKSEAWLWNMAVAQKGTRLALTQESGIPWLKGVWTLPGKARKWTQTKKPSFVFQHQITHHKIYVQLKSVPHQKIKGPSIKWVEKDKLESLVLSSAVKKALALVDNKK